MDSDKIKQLAIHLFHGDEQAATLWLTTPKRALGFESPVDHAVTEEGALEVERLIGRIEYGVFS